MGGGDLNLKKSWHPSTMKNMEKVWKAEQQKHQEKKRIAELKKEIEMEKDREDMTKYAMEQGVIEKKDDKKLDWMYKGPNQMINREEYLLGRPIDKSFEQMAQAEKHPELNQAPKNHVEYECIPPSLRFFSGNEQVDLARKMQEDPLYAIKKKEMETRSQLLKNPVKLKQLKELLEQQTKKSKSNKKNKKKKAKHKHVSDDSGDETELDNLLAAKYKQLKDKINEKDLIKSMKRVKHKRKKSSKAQSDSEDSESDSNSSSSDDSDVIKPKLSKKRRKRSSSTESTTCRYKDSKKNYGVSDKTESKKRDNSVGQREQRNVNKDRTKPRDNYKSDKIHNHRSESYHYRKSRYKDHDMYKSKESDEADQRYSTEKSSNIERRNGAKTLHCKPSTESTQSRYNKEESKRDQRWAQKRKQNLTEEEKEKRRQEMMANASWREKEREYNVKKYRAEEEKELVNNKIDNKDFIRKQLAAAAEVGTVASRIKANINNIQRSGRAMDTNFAKR